MKKPLILVIIFITIQIPSIHAQQGVLEEYIDMGLENNLNLDRERIALEQSHKILAESKASLLPTVDISTRHTWNTGGRQFAIPTGDLMNPVYASLNSIIGEQMFPQIENQVLDFNRSTDVDTRLTVIQPILDRRIWLNKNIVQEQIKSQQENVQIQKRVLVEKIKNGYFNYLRSVKVLDLLHGTKNLIEENLRVSESLYENDKVTIEVVWRAKSDLSAVEYQITSAEKDLKVSQSYFNFLLNRSLDSDIEVQDLTGIIPDVNGLIGVYAKREEWKQLEYGMNALEYQSKLTRSQNLPNLYASFNYGFQGTQYNFNGESDYTMTSLVLSWNLFSGRKYRAQAQRLNLENIKLQNQQQELKQAIELEVIEAYYSFQAALSNRQTSLDREKDASETYRLMDKKYREGLASQIEVIDARNNMTVASLQRIIAHYDLWSAYAGYERATASYEFEQE